jgi:hypothetical protein
MTIERSCCQRGTRIGLNFLIYYAVYVFDCRMRHAADSERVWLTLITLCLILTTQSCV